MFLNYIWIFFFLVAFATALLRVILEGDVTPMNDVAMAIFDMSKTAFTIALNLTGVITFFMGLMKVGEAGGAVHVISRVVRPFFSKLFPEVPKDHPVHGSIVMNFSANMLGLDNAATPMGLKAMKELQDLNPEKDVASNAQIMLLVLNTSGLTLIPTSVMAIRAQQGADNPADVFLPILLATFFSTLGGLLFVAVKQKINLFQRALFIPLAGLMCTVSAILYLVSQSDPDQVEKWSSFSASLILMSVLTWFIVLAAKKKINVYDTFIEGAKEGFPTAVMIIPYLVAILVSIAVFRAAGAMDYLMDGVRFVVISLGFEGQFVDALPTALMKPLSGSGARAMMVDAITTHGVDSFVARLASTFQGSTDTTFYIIAVYFGAVGIKKTRYAVPAGLSADVIGAVAAIFIAYLFFAV